MGVGICTHAYSAANGSGLRRKEAVLIRNIARMPAACALTASAKAAGPARTSSHDMWSLCLEFEALGTKQLELA